MISHPIPPVYDENSEILILGSFPSVKSREEMFFYGHKQNRFWKVLSAIYKTETPETVLQKKNFLLKNGIALWDVIASCDIIGSADSTIENVVPNDISVILKTGKIKRIFTNGSKAHTLYLKYIYPETGFRDILLPSTSPANAAFSLEKLVSAWQVIL